MNTPIAAAEAAVALDGPAVDSPRSLVSVIIPTFNHARYVADAIESVLQQTYRHYEIIVVDDGSTDATREVVAKYEGQIRYVWQENQGLSAARNAGLRVANGEFVALLDADDLYEPVFLQTLLEMLQANRALDGVYCAAQTVDVDNKPLPQRIGKAVEPGAFRSTLLEGGYFPPLCMFAHKYCYDQLEQLFDESLTACEDWDMWLRFSERYSILGIEKPLVRYRVVPGSMSRDPERMIRNRFAVLRKQFAEETGHRHEKMTDYRRALGRSYLRGTIEHLQAGNEEQAYVNLRQAALFHPQLITEFETYYLLGRGAQPMGFRSEFSTLDLNRNLSLLIANLDRLFTDKQAATHLSRFRPVAYGNAFMAMGLLGYGARRFRLARRLLLKSAGHYPKLVLERRYLSVMIKSLLGVRFVEWLNYVKQNCRLTRLFR